MAKRKFPPMPREIVTQHPRVVAMNSAAYGMLNRILDHFWATDCAPLPETDFQILMLSRAHKPTWAQNRDEIKAVLRDVTPELAASMALWRKRSSILRQLGDKGHSTQRLQRAQADRKVTVPMPESYGSRSAERNRAPAPVAYVKQSGSGFTDKPR